MARKPKVCIIGAESWGSAISTAVCKNAYYGDFDPRVHIYVYDELVRSSYLSEVMNERHENIKYLPGIQLDDNLIAVNDLVDAAKEADILIFATSHSFIKPYCNILAGKVKSNAYAVSLIKGLEHIRDGEIDLHSHAISKQLNIPCYSVMSANSAMEMAQGKLCEITIGCNNAKHSRQLSDLFQTENCKVFSIDDVDGVELCNTLKDLVALSAGFIDGLRLGDNARVTCLHLGLKEMMRFIKAFNPTTKLSTFFESCGVANSVASSYADKNVTFAKTFVTSRKTVQEIEANLLNGRKLLGPVIASEIFAFLEREKMQEQYPLFAILHRICQNEVPPEAIVDVLRTHPDLSNSSITRLQKEEYTLPISDLDDVLENLADTVPEHNPSLLENVIGKHSIQGLYDEEECILDPYSQYFRIPNTNAELNDFLELCEKSKMTAVAAIDAAQPNEGNVEYSFEIGAVDNKPEIYLKLQDIIPNPTEMAQNLCDAVATTNLNSDFRFSNDLASSKYLSVNAQPPEMAFFGGKKSGEGEKSSPIAGLTNLIERHVGPYNDKFKALKVRVKVQNDKKSKEPPKKTLNRVETPTKSMHVRKADTKSKSKSNETNFSEAIEEIPGKKKEFPLKTTKEMAKEEILYDRDAAYDKKSATEEPSVTRFVDMIKTRENKTLEQELIEHANATKERLRLKEKEQKKQEKKKSKKNILKFSEAQKSSNQNVFPISQGGYTVDYLKVVRQKKPTITSELQQQSGDILSKLPEVPLQYFNTDNSYRTIQPDLEVQNFEHEQDQQEEVIKNMVAEESEGKSAEKADPKADLELETAGEDQQKLKMAQEFLDEQAAVINNLVMEVETTESLGKKLEETKYLEPENLAAPEDKQFVKEKKATETEDHKEFKFLEPKSQFESQANFEQQPQNISTYEHYKQLEFEPEKTLEKSTKLDETPPQMSAKFESLDNTKHQLSTLAELEKTEAQLEEDIIRAFQNPRNDFDRIMESENALKENSQLPEDPHSLALSKKNQVHGLEDRNLRFYHGKNDGEQGPEWDWLLDSQKFDDDRIVYSDQTDDQPQKKPIKTKSDAIEGWEPVEKTIWSQDQPQLDLENRKLKDLPINFGNKQIWSQDQTLDAQFRELPVHFEGQQLSDVSSQYDTQSKMHLQYEGELPQRISSQFGEESKMPLPFEEDIPRKKSTNAPTSFERDSPRGKSTPSADAQFSEEPQITLTIEDDVPQRQTTSLSGAQDSKMTEHLPRGKATALKDAHFAEDSKMSPQFEEHSAQKNSATYFAEESKFEEHLPRGKSAPLSDSHIAEDSKIPLKSEEHSAEQKFPPLSDAQFMEELKLALQFEEDSARGKSTASSDAHRLEESKKPQHFEERLPQKKSAAYLAEESKYEENLPRGKSAALKNAYLAEESKKPQQFEEHSAQKKSASYFAEESKMPLQFEEDLPRGKSAALSDAHLLEERLPRQKSEKTARSEHFEDQELPRSDARFVEEPVHFEGKDLSPKAELTPAEETEKKALKSDRWEFWKKPQQSELDRSVFDDAEETQEKQSNKQHVEEIEIPQEDINSKVIKAADQSTAKLIAEAMAEDFSKDFNKEFKPKDAELSVEEMLLEDEHFRAILDSEEAKLDGKHEIEYLLEKPSQAVHEEEEQYQKHQLTEEHDPLKTIMTRGQIEPVEREVNYKGSNPYTKEQLKYAQRTLETSETSPTYRAREQSKLRKKVVVRPSFHPPINPRVRIPRPPFDVRDHEYHTVNYRPPPDLMRHASLPLRRTSIPFPVKQVTSASHNVAKLPRPVLRLPSSVMRSSVLAVEVGLFAAFFTRYRGGCK